MLLHPLKCCLDVFFLFSCWRKCYFAKALYWSFGLHNNLTHKQYFNELIQYVWRDVTPIGSPVQVSCLSQSVDSLTSSCSSHNHQCNNHHCFHSATGFGLFFSPSILPWRNVSNRCLKLWPIIRGRQKARMIKSEGVFIQPPVQLSPCMCLVCVSDRCSTVC